MSDDLCDIKKVTEVFETTSESACTAYLKKGWGLLAVAKMDTHHAEWSQPIIKYALGWFNSAPADHPEKEYGSF